MADLKVTPVFKGQPHGHGKIERLIGTVNQMCLAHLPGYAPRGTCGRAGQATLTLPQLDAAIGRFFHQVYNQRPHSETKTAPQARWEAGAFIPRMPGSLEQLDLLLLTVAKPRKIHTEGIHFLSLRYCRPHRTAGRRLPHASAANWPSPPLTTPWPPPSPAIPAPSRRQARTPPLPAVTVRDSNATGMSDPFPARTHTTRGLNRGQRLRRHPRSTPDPLDQPHPEDADLRPGQPRDQPAGEPAPGGHASRLDISDRPPPPHRPGPDGNGHATAGAAAAPIMITKEHRMFVEFADAVRRGRYVGLCFGAPGVGKTPSARHYSPWDRLAHHLDGTRPAGSDDGDTSAAHLLAARAVMYTPKVHNTPHHLDKEISFLCDRLGWNVEIMLNSGRGVDEHGMLNPSTHAELLIVDEADRLRVAPLEQLRDHHDRTGIGLILIGMPGIEKRLSRYSRVGFIHRYSPCPRTSRPSSWAAHGLIYASTTSATTPPLKPSPPSPASPAATSGSPCASSGRSSES
ncbi:AAA family ATPase [Nonomuraea fuscirosea]|uniref:AAA family ATPase n=1 Tax=Nonomuraea fuscirosea TaxID=1291556 RepID=UPI00371EDD16